MSGDSKVLAALVADGIAKQKLHVTMIVDTSRSMQGERIGQVNSAIADIHKYLVDLQSENTNVDFYISIMTFAKTEEVLDRLTPMQIATLYDFYNEDPDKSMVYLEMAAEGGNAYAQTILANAYSLGCDVE